MTQSERARLAKEYIDSILNLQREFGVAQVEPDKYENAVNEATRVFGKLTAAK